MTSSSTGEVKELHRMQSSPEDNTSTHSHRRHWSAPVDSNGDSLQSFRSLDIKSDRENPDQSREHRDVPGVNLQENFSCPSENNGYSFYLGGGKISRWGSSGPPLLTQSRSNVPSPRAEVRRGRSAARKRDMPPFLTTLDCNGRPRFHHRRVRSEGRLEIARVAVDSPEIVSVRGRKGLRIGTVRINQQQEEEEDGDDQQNH